MAEIKEKPSKVLIVDDEESLRKVLKEFLSNHGYEIYIACTSDEALNCLVNRNIDIVISDINRPDVDGLEFMRRVKTFCNADFIILSGTILHKFHPPEECFDAGASAVLQSLPSSLIFWIL